MDYTVTPNTTIAIRTNKKNADGRKAKETLAIIVSQ